MLHTLDLLCKILKYCSFLTLVRLVTTAFGWEFGVSRQYLRLLELLFHFGHERIERVESRRKLNGSLLADCSASTDSSSLDCDGSMNVNSLLDEQANHAHPDDCTARDHWAARRPSTISLPSTGPINPQQHQTKLNRISTPDGPPVFLLDDFDIDDQYDGDELANSCQKHEFQMTDACLLVVRGVSAVIDDQVTKRFTHEELKEWNLLTRNDAKNYHVKSRSLGLFWLFGLMIRYSILMPLRIMFTVTGFVWLSLTMALVSLAPFATLREKLYRLSSQMSFRMLSCGLTSRLEFHNRQYRAKNGDICVANHTSPLDVVLLACDNCYALVGQRHKGIIGMMEQALSRATNHVWFDRGEMRDRQLVSQRLREHVSCKTKLPVLIFPEGTCINNSAVMLFRKGTFECTDRICPVAIKYDSRFGDPFWNSSKQSYLQYLLSMMSSWAIKCDVWYLPPMERLEGESSAEFASRVKAEIAKQGKLDDLNWDGQLKRSAPKELWKHQQQEDYVRRLKLE